MTTPRRTTAATAVGLIGLPLILALSSCSAGASTTSAVVADGNVTTAGQPAQAAPKSVGSASSATDSTVAIKLLATEPSRRSLQVTASMAIESSDVARAANAADAIVAAHRAIIAAKNVTEANATRVLLPGEVAVPETILTAPHNYAAASFTIRVAPGDLPALARDLGKLGLLTSQSQTTDDVTAEVVDVSSRVISARASLARIRTLMSRATNIGDVVSLESELSRREADLESLQARSRALADVTSLATLSVSITSPHDVIVSAEDQQGFVAGLHKGWDAFTTSATSVLTALGAIAPFAITAGVVLVFVMWIRRRRNYSTDAL